MEAYPRECRLAVELIERIGRPVDDLMVQQNEVLRTAAYKFAQGYQGENPFALKMQALVSAKPYRLTLGQMLGVLKIMRRELAAVAV